MSEILEITPIKNSIQKGRILTINLFYAFVSSFFKPNNSFNKTLGYDNRGKMEIKAFDIHTYIQRNFHL